MPSLKRILCAVAATGTALVFVVAAYSAAGDPRTRLNATDQAYAKTIPLRRADLPVAPWHVEPTSFDQANPACVVKRHSLSPLTATGQTGLLYRHRDRAIESDARVFVTAAQSARAFSILSSIGLGRCLASSLAAELSHQASGLKATVSNVEPLSFAGLAAPVRGTKFGVRLRGSYEVKSVHYVFLAVGRGRAVATLGLVRYNAEWPNSFVRPLAKVMAERMTKP